ncbi:hypothetical protein HMPREF0971_01542 [Segatella oris F0302]|uniref:Uncharacterized protein n=1 Tax=Segatella oris F0302 TaxID=649760 RepID=D1QRD8_9BACT|nr:hypothetical protein HMPREF0971_01542 [Segatella oris F0302]
MRVFFVLLCTLEFEVWTLCFMLKWQKDCGVCERRKADEKAAFKLEIQSGGGQS